MSNNNNEKNYKLTFVAIYSYDQDENGYPVFNVFERNKCLGNSVNFSTKIDLQKESDLKEKINEVREIIFGPFVDEKNDSLPPLGKRFTIGKPITKESYESNIGELVIPVEFYIEVSCTQNEFNPDEKTNFISAYTAENAKVLNYKIIGPKICGFPNISQPYVLWKDTDIGKLKEDKNININSFPQEKQNMNKKIVSS